MTTRISKTFLKTFLALVGIIPVGCTVATTQAGQSVRLTSNPEVVRGCQFLGNVTGSSVLTGRWVQQAGAEDAQNDLKEKVAAQGGNTAFVDANNGASGVTAEAYSCPH